jgi:hypothetical protein
MDSAALKAQAEVALAVSSCRMAHGLTGDECLEMSLDPHSY